MLFKKQIKEDKQKTAQLIKEKRERNEIERRLALMSIELDVISRRKENYSN